VTTAKLCQQVQYNRKQSQENNKNQQHLLHLVRQQESPALLEATKTLRTQKWQHNSHDQGKEVGSLGSGCSKLGWQLCTAWQPAQKELQRCAHMPKIGSFNRTSPGQLAEGAGARRRRRVPERMPKASPDK
jgi:hypothetical protein